MITLITAAQAETLCKTWYTTTLQTYYPTYAQYDAPSPPVTGTEYFGPSDFGPRYFGKGYYHPF